MVTTWLRRFDKNCVLDYARAPVSPQLGACREYVLWYRAGERIRFVVSHGMISFNRGKPVTVAASPSEYGIPMRHDT